MIAATPLNFETAKRAVADRLAARESLLAYILYTSRTFKRTLLAATVCTAVDKFILDVRKGFRPILVLQAPPQHGKSEIVSRRLPAYILGIEPNWYVVGASYADSWAHSLAQDARRNVFSPEHQRLFPNTPSVKNKFDVNRMGEFTAPGGSGAYYGVGVNAGLTGRPVTIGIIDDPTKDAQEALSPVTKESHWNWYQSVFNYRMAEQSGQIIMATSWAQDDLPGRILELYRGNSRLTHLRFPAINDAREVGYNPSLPLGALCPELHSIEQLLEFKQTSSDYWWSALYQQSAKALGGNVFKETNDAGLPCVQYWLPKDLPKVFDKVVDSWDCTFKDTDGTDFVVGQKWGKKGANSYFLYQFRKRMSFTRTCERVEELANIEPRPHEILIEDKANGPAVIDFLKKTVPRLIPIEPDGSKLARAHAVTSVWEARNVFLPYPDIAAPLIETGIKAWLSEITIFNAGANDDQVDSFTQALRRLYPVFGRLSISDAALRKAMGR